MHRLLYVMLIPLLWFIFKPGTQKKKINLPAIAVSSNKVFKERLKNRCDELLTYAKQKGYNTSYAFLVDMKISSGSNRFFVCDLKKDSVLASGLVTHGYGMSGDTISFSNTTGSNCTSLGKYKIGNAYHGHFGLAYKLYGLDNTNSNAINRFVVLHSHACVPVSEVAPKSICMSQGCPTVSASFLTVLKSHLDKAEKPVLLYIFY